MQAVAEKCGWIVRPVAGQRGLMMLRKVWPAAYKCMECMVQEARVRLGGVVDSTEYVPKRREDGAIVCERGDGARFVIVVDP